MGEVVGRVLEAVRAGRTITVHGDFDVDGVCATAILVGTLRELGAECDSLIPDRLADGYGLDADNIRPTRRARHLAADHRRLRDHRCRGGRPRQESRSRGNRYRRTSTGGGAADGPILHRSFGWISVRGSGAVLPLAWKSPACALKEVTPSLRSGPGLRWRQLPMWCHWSGRTGPWCGEAWRRSAEHSGQGSGRCSGLLVRADPSSMRATSRSGSRRGSNAAGRLDRADAGVELFLTEDAARADEIVTS